MVCMWGCMGETVLSQGDVFSVDIAVFHRAGIDGACHVESDVEFVVMDSPEECEKVLCAATVECEEERPFVSSYCPSLRLDVSSVESVVENAAVFSFNGVVSNV